MPSSPAEQMVPIVRGDSVKERKFCTAQACNVYSRDAIGFPFFSCSSGVNRENQSQSELERGGGGERGLS